MKHALGNWDHFAGTMYCSIDLTFLERLCKCSFARRGTGICQTALFISFFFSFFFTMITYLFSTWNRMYGLHILIPYNVLENKETVLACCVTRKSPRLPAGKVKWWWGPLLSWSYFYSKICLVIKFIFFLFRFDLQFIIYCYQLFAVNQRLA